MSYTDDPLFLPPNVPVASPTPSDVAAAASAQSAIQAKSSEVAAEGYANSAEQSATAAGAAVESIGTSVADAAAFAEQADAAKTETQAIATQFGDVATAVAITEANKQQTALDVILTEEDRSAAEDARVQAEAAGTAAQVAAGVFGTVAAGLAATTDGVYFNVASPNVGEFIIQYLNSVGTAVRVKAYPSAELIKSWEVPGVLFCVVDKDGKRTFLECKDTDGSPTDLSKALIAASLEDTFAPGVSIIDPDILFGVVDAAGRYTHLTVRASDGQLTDRTLQDIAPRLAPLLPISQAVTAYHKDVRGTTATAIQAQDVYVNAGGEVLPVLPDRLKMVGWGSSSMNRCASACTTMLNTLTSGLGTYYNGAKEGEQSDQICARMGSVPAKLTFPSNQIPASGNVTVTSSNMTTISTMLAFTGTINGVVGTLSYVSGGLQFSRTTSGSVVASPANSLFVPSVGDDQRASVALLWIGKNDTGFAATVTIANTDASVNFLAPSVKRFLVLGHFNNSGSTSGEKTRLATINAVHAARYGRNFFDVQAWLMSPQVWIDTGITQTPSDTAAVALGELPPSLRADTQHLSPAVYGVLIDKQIKPKIQAFGWY